jgi:hypothetical protein
MLVTYTVTETETTVETRTIDVTVTSTLTAAGTVLPIPSQESLTQSLTKTVTLEEVVTRISTKTLTLEEVVTRTMTKTVEEAMPTTKAFREAFREAPLEYLVNPWPELIIRHAYRFLSFVYLCSALVFVYSWLVWGLLLAGMLCVGFRKNDWFSAGGSDWFGNGKSDDGGAGVKPGIKLLTRRENINHGSLELLRGGMGVEARGVGVKVGVDPRTKVRARRASLP